MLKRMIKRRFHNWIPVLRVVLVTMMIMLFIWIQFFYSNLYNNDVEKLYDVNFPAIPNEQVQGHQKQLPYIYQSDSIDYSTHIVDDENKNDENLYNVRLKKIITKLNLEQKIQNLDTYGPLRNDSLVIVIQVHNRLNYLNETVQSFSKARGIRDVLLIFSHDYYDDKINDLVREIKFCKTMQIFFPYSLQIYKKTFPGHSPNDCPQKIMHYEAIKMNCTNAMSPDLYGNYRNANITQIKHHWWWKLNTVFDRLEAVKYYTGSILFLEEDHYMVEDFIHMLRLMKNTTSYKSKIFSLGSHSNDIFYENPKVLVSTWIDNLGMAFNRSVWNELVQCSYKFCYYDDYNWDWTLQKMTKDCLNRSFWTSTLLDSRVHHIGECGIHHANNCTSMEHVTKLKKKLSSIKLYPQKIDVTEKKAEYWFSVGNGGWGDKRDHKLCMDMIVQRHKIQNGSYN